MGRNLYRLLPLWLVIVLLAAGGVLAAYAAPLPSGPNFAALDSYVESHMRAARIPGAAVAVVQGNQILHLKGYGTADAAGRAVTPQTPFMLASTTKAITAIAILQLVEAGQIDLDAPVQTYLPWFQVADPDASAPITVRRLLTHTSGISTAAGDEVPPDTDLSDGALEARVRRLKSAQLSHPVGERFQYSSANFDTLGLIVQVVSGQTYEDYLQAHIFQPLGMLNSYVTTAEARQNGLSTGYRSWLGFPVAFAAPHTRAYAPSGGSVSASAEDMAHLMIAMLNDGRYGEDSLGLSSESMAAMQSPAVRSFNDTTFTSLGWSVSTLDGVQTVGAGGDISNFKTRLLLAPEKHIGVAVLINMNSVNVNTALFDWDKPLMSLLLGQPPVPQTQPHNMMILVSMIVILSATVLFLVGIVRYLVRRPYRQGGRLAFSAGIVLPLLATCIWALLLLVGLPQMTGRSLPFMLLYLPDFGWSLLIGAGMALSWGVVQTVTLLKAAGEERLRVSSRAAI